MDWNTDMLTKNVSAIACSRPCMPSGTSSISRVAATIARMTRQYCSSIWPRPTRSSWPVSKSSPAFSRVSMASW